MQIAVVIEQYWLDIRPHYLVDIDRLGGYTVDS